VSAHGLLITCQRVPKARAHSHLRFFRTWRVAAPVHDLFFRGRGQGQSAVSQPRSKQGSPSPIIDLAQGQRALPTPRSNGCAARRSSARAEPALAGSGKANLPDWTASWRRARPKSTTCICGQDRQPQVAWARRVCLPFYQHPLLACRKLPANSAHGPGLVLYLLARGQ
jgi:hypothetical protein